MPASEAVSAYSTCQQLDRMGTGLLVNELKLRMCDMDRVENRILSDELGRMVELLDAMYERMAHKKDIDR